MGIHILENNPSTTTSAYVLGDVMGGLLSLGTIGIGELKSLTIIDLDGLNKPVDLVLYNREPASIADNNAYSVTGAETYVMHHIEVLASDYRTLDGTVTVAQIDLGSLPIKVDQANNTDQQLYAYLVARSGVTFSTASALTLRLALGA